MVVFKLGIIGCGHMGEAILKGVLDSQFLDSSNILAFEIKNERKEYIKKRFKISFADNMADIIKNSEYLLISVKPQDLSELLKSVKLHFDSGKNVIISIVAGIPTEFVESKIGGKPPVVRIMPNTPALVNRCMSAISAGRYVSRESLDFTIDLIKNLGDYVLVNENLQNIATALSGSGPAYFFLICKYLIESGIREGLEHETAKKLVVNTMIGAGEMMKQCDKDADELIRMVASPGGTTERALDKLNEKNLKTILALAVESAKNRADELLDSLND